MRDALVALALLAMVPFMLRAPIYALLGWIWIGVMNPHRLTYGWAYDFPFAMGVALILFASCLLNHRKLEAPPANAFTISLIAFMVWLNVSPMFSLHPEHEFPLWSRALKIQIMVFAALFIVNRREHIHWVVLVAALSVAFFGVKGGFFTLISGGNFLVWGPANSFIEDNNTLALATLMVVPLLRYLHLQATHRMVRMAYAVSMVLCLVAVVGSYSRGALLALGASLVFFAWKSRARVVLTLLLAVAVTITLTLMPDRWFDRMNTIQNYDELQSVQGRFNAWWMCLNLAKDRFPIGGGFAIYEPDVFARYAPDPLDLHAAHSIYFQVLGEHGFIGLALFLMLFAATYWNARWVIRRTVDRPDLRWANDLARMIQVALVAYSVGGAFLSLSYFDLPYYMAIAAAATRTVVARAIAGDAPARSATVTRGPLPRGGLA
jgi:probable O-glycosylation ligase (exosortase A-associated)